MEIYPLIKDISTRLFEADVRRLNARVIVVNRQNKSLLKSAVDGFLFQGVGFRPIQEMTVLSPKKVVQLLHRSLSGEMEEYLQDAKEVEVERQNINQVLFLLLKPCQSRDDVRDTLPECLVSFVPKLSSRPRQREAAFTLAGNPRALRQYTKTLPKMEVYSTARLLY